MSLNLRGTPTVVSYSQVDDTVTTSSTAQAVAFAFFPLATVTAPVTLMSEGVDKTATTGFSFKQISNVLCEMSWTTATDVAVHQFAVADGIQCFVAAVYDITAETVSFYVNSETPALVETSVGLPTRALFKLHVKTSNVLGEDWTLSDLTVWVDGKPSAPALTAFMNDQYFQQLFKNSGSSDKYMFLAGQVKTEFSYPNLNKITNFLELSTPPLEGDPDSPSGPLDVVNAAGFIDTQVGTSTVTYWDYTDTLIDRGKYVVRFVYHPSFQTIYGTDDDIVNIPPQYYNPATDEWSIPDDFVAADYANSYDMVIGFDRIGQNATFNSEYYAGPWVITWEGTMRLAMSGAGTVTTINPNRLEFTTLGVGTRAACTRALAVAGAKLKNLRIFKKAYEPLLDAGRMYNPQIVEYFGRYNTIRMMDISNTNGFRYTKLSQIPAEGTSRNLAATNDQQVRLAMECDREMWYNVPLFLGADKSTMPAESDLGPVWEAYGSNQALSIDYDAVYEYLEDLVKSLNTRGYPLNRRLFIEVGNEIWNNGFYRSHMYCYGIKHTIAGVSSGKLPIFGLGYLAYRFISLFKKALKNLGRENQVLVPIMATQTVWYDQTKNFADGAVASRNSLPVNERLLDIPDFKLATTSYTNAFQQWNSNTTLLGEEFADRYEFIDKFRDLAINNEELLRRYIYKSQVKEVSRNDCLHNPSSLAIVASYGITGPIHNYEGSSHNNVIMHPDFAFKGGIPLESFRGKGTAKVVLADIDTSSQSVMSLVPENDRNNYLRIFYQTTTNGNTVTPVLVGGNPTGQFTLSGTGSGSVKVYIVDSLGPWVYDINITYTGNTVAGGGMVLASKVHDSMCPEAIVRYNKSRYSVSVNDMSIESAALNGIVATTANFGTLGADDGFLGAWHIADGHNTLATDIRALTWETYIAPEVPADTIWTNYVTYMSTYTPPSPVYGFVGIDPISIRAEYTALTTTTADAIRLSGSVFASSGFNSIDLQGGEFFYKPTVGTANYAPILANTNFTGQFNISGSAVSTATMYYYETSADEWYEIVINTQGGKVNFTTNNLLNVAPNAAVFLTGLIYGVNGLSLSGSGIEFSNNGSTWTSSAGLISGVTMYRKAVTAPAQNDAISTVPIAITDGVDTFTGSADVLTSPGTDIAFANATEAFSFAENVTGTIATFSASATKVVTYSLTGDDAALFAVNSSGAISPLTARNFEAPGDSNNDGVYEFTLNAVSGTESVSVDITATLTNVIEHSFAYAGIMNQSNVVPASTVTVTSQLLGGTGGVIFSVVGMTSSNDGGTTYSSANKAYVVGSTYIRFTKTAANTYNNAEVVTGTLSLENNADPVTVSFNILTKAPMIPIDMGTDVRVESTAQTSAVSFNPSPIAGNGTITFAITGGADSSLFVINTTTGILSWVTPPTFNSAGGTTNDYVVVVSGYNTDGFSNEVDEVVVTVEVIESDLAVDLPDLSIIPLEMSDGSWTTDLATGMSVIGTPSGTGIATVKGYHDVVKFVKIPKVRTVTINSIDTVVGGTAASALSGRYLVAQSAGSAPMTMNVTLRDSTGTDVTFEYTITF